MNNEYFLSRDHCPACSSKDFSEIVDVSFETQEMKQYLERFYEGKGEIDLNKLTNGNYIVCECNNCSLLFQKEIGNDKFMQELYDKWLASDSLREQNVRLREMSYYMRYITDIHRFITTIGKSPGTLKILDFGAGWGNWLQVAKSFGCEVYGTELSLNRAGHMRKNGISVISYDEIPSHGFDLINTDQVFEHVSEPLVILEQLTKGLKTGGLLRICVPDGTPTRQELSRINLAASRGEAGFVGPVKPLEHINCFNYKSLKRLGESHGLQEIKLHKFPYVAQLNKNTESVSGEFKSILSRTVSFSKRCAKLLIGKKRPANEFIHVRPTDLLFQKVN